MATEKKGTAYTVYPKQIKRQKSNERQYIGGKNRSQMHSLSRAFNKGKMGANKYECQVDSFTSFISSYATTKKFSMTIFTWLTWEINTGIRKRRNLP